MCGFNGVWSIDSSDYGGIIDAGGGQLAYYIGYTNMNRVYLRRDGTLPMTGNLNMGGENIHNVNAVLVGTDPAFILDSNEDISPVFKTASNVPSTFLGTATFHKKATFKADALFEDGFLSNGNSRVNGTFTVAGGDLVVQNNIRSGVAGPVVISDSEGLRVDDKLEVDGYIISKLTKNIGDFCYAYPEGAIAKTPSGKIVTCQNNKWTSAKSGIQGIVIDYLPSAGIYRLNEDTKAVSAYGLCDSDWSSWSRTYMRFLNVSYHVVSPTYIICGIFGEENDSSASITRFAPPKAEFVQLWASSGDATIYRGYEFK